jgi:hypothetical protein
MPRAAFAFALALAAGPAAADGPRALSLIDEAGGALQVAELRLSPPGADGAQSFEIDWDDTKFGDYFLSMRPFKCIEGPKQLWCRVPYPYAIARQIRPDDLTDLEYATLFVWKRKGDYGIDLWNGVYYAITAQADGALVGRLHDYDMNALGIPPDAGEMRPIGTDELTEGPEDGRWLPGLVIAAP